MGQHSDKKTMALMMWSGEEERHIGVGPKGGGERKVKGGGRRRRKRDRDMDGGEKEEG